MSTNCDFIVIFPIYGQFGAIWKPDSDSNSLIVTFYLTGGGGGGRGGEGVVSLTAKQTLKKITQIRV